MASGRSDFECERNFHDAKRRAWRLHPAQGITQDHHRPAGQYLDVFPLHTDNLGIASVRSNPDNNLTCCIGKDCIFRVAHGDGNQCRQAVGEPAVLQQLAVPLSQFSDESLRIVGCWWQAVACQLIP